MFLVCLGARRKERGEITGEGLTSFWDMYNNICHEESKLMNLDSCVSSSMPCHVLHGFRVSDESCYTTLYK